MSNRMKAVIVLGVLGIVLLVAGIVMGSGPTSLPLLFSEVTLPEGAADPTTVAVADIHAIDLRFTNSDIVIKTGEAYSTSAKGGLADSYVLDGTLHFGASDAKHSTKVLGLSLASKWICGYGSFVLVIPPEAQLDQITINTSRSNVTCDALIASKVNIQVNGGNLDIARLQSTDQTEIHVPNGTLNISNASVTASATIDAGKDIAFGSPASEATEDATAQDKKNKNKKKDEGDSEASTSDVINNLTLTSKSGGIVFYGKPTGTAMLKAKKDISACLTGTESNYTLSAPHNNMNKTAATEPATDTSQFGTVTLDTRKGQCNVTFQ